MVRSTGRIGFLISAVSVAALLVAVPPAPAQEDPAPDVDLSGLEAATSGDLLVEEHGETRAVRFLGTESGRPLDLDAEALIDQHAEVLGVTGDSALVASATEELPEGGEAVRYQQEVAGVPVLAGEVVVETDEDGKVRSVTGEASATGAVDPSPEITAAEAAAAAVAVTERAHDGAQGLTASEPERWLFDPALLDGPEFGPARLVWRTEVTDPGVTIRELVLVDAASGGVALHFDQIAHGRQRRICDQQNVPDPDNEPVCVAPFARTEGQAPTGNADVDLAYDFSGDTYGFFFNRFGRDSLDDKGMQLRSTVRWCPSGGGCPYANAFWNGAQMTYGQGFAAADDVVGHELSHGVTDFTSDLLYYYQSGAINEALSDIFGELIDLSNGAGTDTAGVRWLLGEDVPVFGAIRDMEHPPTFGQPDTMTSPNYTGTAGDNGGVHTNSGVANKTAFLLTDGGTFNGQTISPLGLNKVARIFYRVEAALLTSGSDYADLAVALPQACTNLVGTAGITTADCAEVGQAVLATEMATVPPNSPAPEAPVCPAGEVATNRFSDKMENPSSGNWTFSPSSGSGAWANETGYAHGGERSLWGPDLGSVSDTIATRSAGLVLPAGAFLWFAHAYDFEGSAFDGGVVEYSTDGGANWQTDANSLFTHNGYTGTVNASFGNPLGGRPAFVGTSRGYVSSRLDLSALAGQDFRFRFRIGTDSLAGDLGWFVDDVRIYTCAVPQCDGLPVTVNLPSGQTPTAGNHVILGTAANNTINGLGGNDRICGLGGRDTINGGAGNDRIFGAAGNDSIKGAGGADRLDGGTGNDTLDGGAGNDVLLGQSGADRLNGGPNRDTCQGGTQADTASSCEVRSGIP